MERVNTTIEPEGYLALLSRQEAEQLRSTSAGPDHETLRRCALAVLHFGDHTDNAVELLREFENFDVEVIPRDQGAALRLSNAPASAFVDGQIIRGIGEHLFAVVRDLLYAGNEILADGRFDLQTSAGITNAVFHLLRNAGTLDPAKDPRLVVCWGGHAIARNEYDYTKEVGHQLGLRDLNICTGCGPGAMKGPMKGATIGRAKRRAPTGRYLGITEPGIVASEPPNPIVNELVIMPDIEKRLEAFVRVAQAIILFPGGVGSAEELLYLLGVLLHPDNRDSPIPLLLTGPAGSQAYFAAVDDFISRTLGRDAQALYKIVIDDPAGAARFAAAGIKTMLERRRSREEPLQFNWPLQIDAAYQLPFAPTHDAMAALELSGEQPPHVRAANLRRAFSGIVAGNVKPDGIAAIEAKGPFSLRGDPGLLQPIDSVLQLFVQQGRMRINGGDYVPCYRLAR